jgi:hypothetical protein
VCILVVIELLRFCWNPSGLALVQGTAGTMGIKKVSKGEEEEAKLAQCLPSFLLQAWPEPRGTSSQVGGGREKATADVKDIQVRGKHNLTHIYFSVFHSLLLLVRCLL